MTALAQAQQLKAEALIREAEDLLDNKPWFSWLFTNEQNVEKAADAYEGAANAYKVGGLSHEAGNSYMELGKLYRELGSDYCEAQAAKAFNSAGEFHDMHTVQYYR